MNTLRSSHQWVSGATASRQVDGRGQDPHRDTKPLTKTRSPKDNSDTIRHMNKREEEANTLNVAVQGVERGCFHTAFSAPRR